MQVIEDGTQIGFVLLNVRFPNLRKASSPEDFGDPETIWMHVKRRGTSIMDSDVIKDCGLFLGDYHGIGWVIVNKGLDGKPTSRMEVFESLEELKQQWQLD